MRPREGPTYLEDVDSMPYIIYNAFRVRWQISENSSPRYSLKSIPGLYILNPFKYASAYEKYGFAELEHEFKFKDDALMDTTGLIIGYTKPLNFSQTGMAEQLVERISELFKYARLISMQYDLNYKVGGSFYAEHDKIRMGSVDLNEVDHFGMTTNHYKTHLKWSELKKADIKKFKEQAIPIYKELAIDAVEAHFEKDYRKSILFFCIACETFVSTVLSDRYEKLKLSKRHSKKMISESGKTKDPVLEMLLANKWHFKFKLHEHFLYVFNRSLRIENKNLFDRVLKLYATRNKIAHEGYIKVPKSGLLNIDNGGSEEAFDIVIELFEWLGDLSLNIFRKRSLEVIRS